jgi:hypothetical protein
MNLTNAMVRLVFLAACALYLAFLSLFVQTSHVVIGDRHIFSYGWNAILLGLGFNLIPLGTAWFLWRVRKDRIGAAIFLLIIPLIGTFVMPQYFMERVEVTPTHLSHRREPPHTRYNADIAFADITSAVEINHESGTKGYRMRLKDGQLVELPANTVLTAARDTIDTQLRARGIPLTSEFLLRVNP